jgi:hypothetical protein
MVMRRPTVRRPSVALVVVGWVVAMAWSSGSIAEIYKWVDQKGVTNYSATPPATGKARALDPAAATVSVYQATAPQDAARLDALMRQKVAMLEDQLRAARQTQQASYQTDSDRHRLTYEQCLRERRVDCDRTGTSAMPYPPYLYAAAAPVLVVGRPFPLTPMAPFTPTTVFGTTVGFSQPGFSQPRGGSMRTAPPRGRGSSRKF